MRTILCGLSFLGLSIILASPVFAQAVIDHEESVLGIGVDFNPYAVFIGQWEGNLIVNVGMLSTGLEVKSINSEGTAVAVYSQGNLRPFTAFTTEIKGKFLSEKKLQIKFQTNATIPTYITITYTISDDGKTLKAEYEGPGRHYLGTLDKK